MRMFGAKLVVNALFHTNQVTTPMQSIICQPLKHIKLDFSRFQVLSGLLALVESHLALFKLILSAQNNIMLQEETVGANGALEISVDADLLISITTFILLKSFQKHHKILSFYKKYS